LIEPEEVGRIIVTLDRSKPVPRRLRVRLVDARLALIVKEIDVRGSFTLPQRRRELGDPGLVRGLFVGVLIEGREIHHDPPLAMRERGGLDGHTRQRTAEHA